MDALLLDLIRFLTPLPFLAYSCYTDVRERRVPNKTWIPLVALGAIYALVEALLVGWPALLWTGVSVGVMSVIGYALFYAGAFGGADAKALIALSLVVPHYPNLSLLGAQLPLHPPLIDLFAFGVFGNAVLLTIVVPLGLFLFNAVRGDWGVYMFLGYRANLKDIRGRHLRLMERLWVEDGEIKTRFQRGGVEVTEDVLSQLERWRERSLIDGVWVTPGLPFLIPIALGFITAALYGDLILQLTLLLQGIL